MKKAVGKQRALITTAVLLVMAMLQSCIKNEFTVEFDLPSDVDRTYTLIYYASDRSKGWVIETVVSVKKGKAVFTGHTVRPTLVYIMSNSGSSPRTFFYAERGNKLKITGKSQNPDEWTIRGNSLTDRLTEFRLSEVSAISAARTPSDEGARKLNGAISSYVKKNSDQPASALLLLTMYDRRIDPEGFAAAFKSLKGDARDTKWHELTGISSETLTDSPMPKRIELTTIENGCDTIVPGRSPAILFFSRPTSDNYREDMETLRDLSREFPDSSRRVIADISFETDSLSRCANMRRDSLKNAVHGWMPLGVSDATAQSLNVRRAPYAIVLGADGKPRYRGDNVKKAAEAFRKAMKQKQFSQQ